MKNFKKISVLISLVLISIIALGAVSAAEDTVGTDDADLAAVNEITVDDTPTTDEINSVSTDIAETGTGDSGDSNGAVDDVISDSTGVQDESGNGSDEDAVVTDVARPKNVLKAESVPDEPLGAGNNGTWTDLYNLIQSSNTINLDKDYSFDISVDNATNSPVHERFDNGAWINRQYIDFWWIDVGKSITINGNGHTIDGKGLASLFRVSGAYTITLNDVNIVNCAGSGNNWNNRNNHYGSVILGQNAGAMTLNINNCNFTGNSVGTGNNNYRGGVFYVGAATVNIKDSQFNSSTAQTGGVLYVSNGATIVVENSNFTANSADGQGGVFYASGSTLTITDSQFNRNVAGTDGGVYANGNTNNPSTLTITGSNFTSNRAANGGVIQSPRGVTVSDSSFINNNATTSGGVIYLSNTGVANLRSSIFINNSANNYGGVVYLANANTHLDANYNVIMDNKANRGHLATYTTPNSIDSIDYNWWGQNVYTDRQNVQSQTENTFMSPTNHYILKLRQLSATVIEVSLNSLDTGTLPGDAKLPMREYFMTISPDDAFIRNPTGNFTGAAVSNFTVPGNGTITAKVDYETIVLDIYQNTRDTIELNITVADVVLPNKPVAIVEASFDDVYNVTVGEKVYEVTVSGGVGQVELDELPEGTYLAMLSHVGNDAYHDAYNLTTFHVSKAESAISIAANTTTPVYGTDVMITPTITSADGTATITNGTVIYTVDGKNYAALEANQNLTVTGLSAGEHRIVARYGGNDEYEGSTSLELLINVQKATLNLSIVGAEVVYPESGKITLNSNVDGVYTIYVGEVPYEVRVSLGSGTVAIPTLDVGNYSVSITVAESENYTAASASGTYNVTKALPRFNIDGDDYINYGETNIIHPIFSADVTGNITYYIDEETEGTKLPYNQNFTTPVLDAGPHFVRAVYSGDVNFDSVESTWVFGVRQVEVNVDIIGDTVSYPNRAVINVTADVPNTYIITVNGTPYEVVLTEDELSKLVRINTIPIGVYYVSVTANETTNYKAVNIDKAATVVVNKPNLNLTVSNATITYGENATLQITLKDGDIGITMDNIEVSIGDAFYYVKVTDGVGTLNVSGLNVGSYIVVAVCAEDPNYEVVFASANITVNKAAPSLSVSADPITFGNDAIINITLDGVNSEKITGIVKVTVNGETYAVAVNEGVGSLTVSGLPTKEEGYAISAAFEGNEKYEAATAQGTLVVGPSTVATIDVTGSVVIYGDNSTITVTVTDGAGNAIAVNKINVTIGEDEPKEFDVAADGTVNLGMLDVGSYNVVVTFDDGVHVADSASATVVVNPSTNAIVHPIIQNYTVNEDGLLRLAVYQNDDVASGLDGTVIVEVDGVVYKDNVPISGGFGKVDLIGFGVGEHNVKVTFNNANYHGITNITVFNVSKAEPTVAVIPIKDSFAYGEDAVINVTVKDGNKNIAGTVKVTVDGVVYSVDVINGIGQVTVKGLANGTYDVSAKFLGNENYTEADATAASFVVNASTAATIAVTGSVVTYGENSTITVNVTDGAGYPVAVTSVNVSIDGGSPKEYAVNNGVVDLGKFNGGSYVVEVSFDDGVHVAEPALGTFVVNPSDDAVIFLAAQNHTVGAKGNLIIIVLHNNTMLEGYATIEVDGVVYKEDVVIGLNSNVINLTGFAVGEHTVKVTFHNDNYAGVTNTTVFNVSKAEATVAVIPVKDSFAYGEDAVINVTLKSGENNITGTVKVTVGGVDYSVDVTDGVGQAIVKGLANGTYTVDAKFLGNVNYTEANATTASFVVNASTTATIAVTGSVVTYGNRSTINVNVTDGAGYPVAVDKVNVTIRGASPKEYDVNDGVVDLGKFNASSYDVFVSFDDGVHVVEPAFGTFVVNPSSDAEIYIEIQNYTVDQTGNMKIAVYHGVEVLSGNVTIEVDGVVYKDNYEITQIFNEIDLIGFAAGEHAVKITFHNDNYVGVTNTAVFNVSKAEATVAVIPINDSFAYGEDAVINVTLKSGENNITGTVKVTVGGVDYSVDVTDGVGQAIVKGLANGTYTVDAKFLGNVNYTEANATTASFVVNASTTATIAVTGSVVTYGNKSTIKVNVTDGAGYPVAVDKVNVTIGASTEEFVVAADGTVDLGKFAVGSYDVEVSFNDGVHVADSASATVVVNPSTDAMVVLAAENYTVTETGDLVITVSNADGPLDGVATIEIDGVIYKENVPIENGANTTVLTGFAVGEHTVKVTFNNANYQGIANITVFNVSKAEATVAVIPVKDSFAYGEDAVINVTLKDGENNLSGTVKVTVAGTEYSVTVTDGVGQAIVKGLANGTYTVDAKFLGNVNYTEADATPASFVVNASTDATITATGSEVTYGENSTVAISVVDGAGNPVAVTTVKINGTDFAVTDGVANIGKLAAGTYTVPVVFDDGVHEALTTQVTLKVNPAAAVITAEAADYVFDETGKLIITVNAGTSPLSGTVNVTIDRKVYKVEAINGRLEITLEGLSVGVHDVDVAFINANYTAEPAYTNFTVTQKTPVVTVVAAEDSFAYGEDAVINVTVKDGDKGVSGTVVVTIAGTDYSVTVTDGVGQAIVKGLSNGTYTATAKFNGNVNYTEASSATPATVVVNASTDAVITVTGSVVTYGDNSTITVKVVDGAGNPVAVDKVNVTIGASTEEFVVAADGTVDLGKLAVGSYDVEVSFNDGVHVADSASATVVVNPSTDAMVVLAAENYTVTETGDLVITVSNADGPLDGVATIEIDGVIYKENVPIENGVNTTVLTGFAVGEHTVKVTFNNANYQGIANITVFNVSKAVPTVAVVPVKDSFAYGEDVVINVTVKDGEKGVSGTVKVTVAGTEYSVTLTDGVGQATVKGLANGTYTVEANFLGNENYTEADATPASFVVNASTDATITATGSEVTYGENSTVAISVVDGAGNPVAVTTVKIDGTEYAVTDGVANIGKLAAGTYTVPVVFNDGVHKEASTEVTLKVKPAAAVITAGAADYVFDETGKLIITVNAGTSPLSGTVNVTIDRKDYKVEAINGRVEITLEGLSAGVHDVDVSFINANYTAEPAYTNFTVTQKTPVVTVVAAEDSFAYGEDAIINVTVKDGDKGVSGTVVVTIAGTEYSVNVTDGVGQAKAKGLANGTYTADAKFIGNVNYTEASSTTPATVVVNASTDAIITATGSEVTYGEDSTVTISVVDGAGNPIAVTTVKINDTDYAVTDGKVTIGKLDAGTYTVPVVFNDGVHKEASTEVTLIVKPISAEITADATDYVFDQTGKLTITVKDGDGNDVAGKVNVTIDGASYKFEDIDGSLEITLENLATGLHNVDVAFVSPNYAASPAQTTFTVTKKTPAVSITVDPATIKQTESTTVKVSLLDGDKKLDGTVVVTVGGVDYSVDVVAGEGSVVVSNLAPANYTVTAKFSGNENYTEAVAEGQKLEVTRVAKVDLNVSTDGNNIVIKLTDEDKKPVDGKVNVTIDGKTQEVTVKNGVATVPTTPGNHNVTVVYPGDAVHGGTKVVNNIVNVGPKVIKIGTVFTVSRMKVPTYNKYLDSKKDYVIYVTLKDVNGKILVGKKVRYASHGKTVTRTTNSKGQIKFYVTHTPAGMCNRALSFIGDSKYKACFKTVGVKIYRQKVKLVVKKKTFKSSQKVKKLTAKLTNTKGKKIGGRKIVFTVNGKKYTAKTNKKGIATVKVKLTSKKTYKVKVKFAGDKTFKKATKNSSVKIK